MKLILDDTISLIGNSKLATEYRCLGQEFHSETASMVIDQLLEKTTLIEISREGIGVCATYFPDQRQIADIFHAATAFQSRSIVITNDNDFDQLKKSGLIEIWSISDAIRKLLKETRH
jgi:predicted nucleic acid-binding protein